MAQPTFLDRLAADILAHYPNAIDLTVVLPNKRARIFLLDAIRKQVSGPLLAPRIISVEELVTEMSGLKAVDNVGLLFAFYNVYLEIMPAEQAQTFDLFSNWAVTLLQDFNEIDRYLLEPDRVFSYLKDIDDIKRWNIGQDEKTPLIEKYVGFWQQLPQYYHGLHRKLRSEGKGYQGMLYREAIHNLEHMTVALQENSMLFAGFNALNAAEETLFQHLLVTGKARVVWDADKTFLDDPLHDAGLFLRRYRDNWPYYRSHPFEWIGQAFSEAKDIRIIGTPKSVGQAYIVGTLLETLETTEPHGVADHTALVLGDESLLLPVLHALPDAFSALNITMGYPAKGNPVQVLLARVFRLHVNATAKSGYVFYHRDLLEILGHPIMGRLGDYRALAALLRRNNFTFIRPERLRELLGREDAVFDLVFSRWEGHPGQAIDRVSELLLAIRRKLDSTDNADAITGAFVYTLYQTLNKLANYCRSHPHVTSLETVYALYRQAVQLAEVSFEGEPLGGLQIMGVLESRVLDFDTVIVTSVNEGSFPAGKSSNSFIPHDVKRELGLPTYKEKDAIYTYHFYHLLQRAQKIFLLYNTESEGLDAGEKSRFITQLEIETQAAHRITHEIWNAPVPDGNAQPTVIEKSPAVQARLREIATSSFSPSALTTYIRNPIEFYFRRILRIREADEVEENIAVNTLGTIIHGTLESLYRPLIGKSLTVADLEGCEMRLEQEVARQFKEVYREGDIRKGKNLLAFEVARRHVSNYLAYEKAQITEEFADITVLALEEEYSRWIHHPSLPFPVLLKGNVDRIERRNGRIRIVDFKTGRAEQRNLALPDWDTLISPDHDKIIQVLAYAFMYESEANGLPIEAGVISFKNLKSGFLGFRMKGDQVSALIDGNVLEAYENGLVALLREILDPAIPFSQPDSD